MHFPAGQGAKHGKWEDPTFTASTAEIHAPRYFKEFEEFGTELAAAKSDELMLKDVLTKDVYDKYLSLPGCGPRPVGGIRLPWYSPCRRNACRFSAVSLQAECTTIFRSVLAGGLHDGCPQCPCRRNVRRFSIVSLQAECSMIFCSVPVGGMPDDFLLRPCRRGARRFFCSISIRRICNFGAEKWCPRVIETLVPHGHLRFT